jgi:GT2 family glycosyltransferase
MATGIVDGAIEGWIEAGSSSDDVYVEALVEGEAAFGRSKAIPGSDGRLHFAIEIPASLRDGRMRFLDARLMGEDRPLPGGPLIFDGGLFDAARHAPADVLAVRRPDALEVEGMISVSPPGLIEGWAWAPGEPARRLKLEVVANGRFVCAITADQPREDLKARGVGDGRYGFRFDPSRLLRRGPHQLIVRVEGSAEPLPGGPVQVGPFAPDGEADCPGYLDDEAPRRAMEALPFEHLAFDARRIAPERLTPRLINRLRRERAAMAGAPARPMVLLTPGGRASSQAARRWSLQSWPAVETFEGALDPGAIRDLCARADRIFLARPDDLIHPSAAAIAAGRPADVMTWSRFAADEARAGSAGTALRRPPFDPVTARHGAQTDATLAIRGSALADAPDDVLDALAAGRLHPLWFWLAGAGLAWAHHPEALTSAVGAPPVSTRDEITADEAVYRRLLADEGGRFSLERTAEDLPFPYVLVPTRRAGLVSVLISFRDRRELTLRCLAALARQRLTGELEVVLVDNQSRPEEASAVLEAARRLFGEARVKALAYDHPFSHSAQNNLAARSASGEALVFLNNDVVLKDPALIEQLAAWAIQPGIGAVGCRLEDPERGLGSYGHVFTAPSGNPFQPPLRENSDPAYGRFVHAVPGATLALAAFDRDRFLELGGLDEARFPIGYNDLDLMLRASRQGMSHIHLGHLAAEHVRGSSRSGDNEDRQALAINQAYPEAALGHTRQLAAERIETRREDLSPARRGESRSDAADKDREADKLLTLQAEIAARQAREQKRADIAEAYARASDLVRSLEGELAAARAIGEAD